MYNPTYDFMIEPQMKGLLSDLQVLVRQPSISSKNEGLEECAKLVSNIMRKSGIYSSVIYYDTSTKNNRSVVPPIVYGEVKSKSNPNGNTLLFYNHYDVQPVEPAARWRRHPFSGDIEDGKIFGRGAADDKGELITRIKAVEQLLRETGDVPCNVKFLVEGEEEIGSPHMRRYLEKFGRKLECDCIIWEFGYIDTKGRPIINLGMKGILYVELYAFGPSTDIHSSLAALVKNPAWNLIKALNTIWDDTNGKVLIRDWYREVRPFTSKEESFMVNQPQFDEIEFKKKYRLNRFLRDIHGEQIKRTLAEMPTCNISGIVSGHIGNGAKTILPSFAKTKIDFRLVPDMLPQKQFERLRRHLMERGFGDIDLKFIHGMVASRTLFTDRFVEIVKRSAEKIYDKRSIINLSSAGSGPVGLIVERVKAPCVAVGCTHIFSNIHSYNEYARIDLLNKGTKLIASIMQRSANYKKTDGSS
jgi:acetylornithine deacetylase/succinyl-diaminopimelate desuccinylase-like protein